MNQPVRFFDAHLDLAYLAENGRDMSADAAGCGGPHLPAAVTLPELHAAGVAACLATIFTEAGGDDAVAYPPGDAEAAHAAGTRQLRRYARWFRERSLSPFRSAPAPEAPPRAGILMECADPIRSPDELGSWTESGVVAIGLAWARGSRYATGNSADSASSGAGLSPLGRELVRRMDDAKIVHDASHLSDRALDDLLSLTDRPVIATHSNCRALLAIPGEPPSQRHLTNDAIREIARRGGVIGLNLFAPFVRAGLDERARPEIADALAHVEHICGLVGHRRAVGLGSDLDGGFSAERTPRGITSPRNFRRLTDALAARAWPDADVRAFAWDNWARFWGLEPM